LLSDGPRGCLWIASTGDGTAYDKVAGTGPNSIRWSDYARLVARAYAGWADSRRNKRKATPEHLTQAGTFLSGGNDAAASCVDGQLGKPEDLGFNINANTGLLQFGRTQ
jgi:hypothetical protein